jgi:hypothetical protein
MVGKILLILGILGILLGAVVTIVSLLLPGITRNVSPSEAAIGVVAGIIVLIVSFVPAIVGVIVMIMKKKKAQA